MAYENITKVLREAMKEIDNEIRDLEYYKKDLDEYEDEDKITKIQYIQWDLEDFKKDIDTLIYNIEECTDEV